tara:strand:- start:176 stop:1333 length:1158 start_codon:yes stop_codon:yes gene_type:complete
MSKSIKKVAHNVEQIVNKNGSVSYRIRVTDPHTSERHSKTIKGITRTDAVIRKQEWERDLRNNTAVNPNRITVAQWLDQWLEEIESTSELSYNTIKVYRSTVKKHLNPHLGELKLQNLKLVHCQQMFNKLSDLSPKTLNRIKNTIVASFNRAIDYDYINVNPARKVNIPTGKVIKEYTIYTPEMMVEFAEEAKDSPCRDIFILQYLTGTRINEALGLQESDIDFETKQLSIKGQAQRQNGKIVIAPTKTKKSRTIPLSENAIQLIKSVMTEKKKLRLKAKTWEVNNFLFTMENGKPYYAAKTQTELTRILKTSKLPKVTTQDFRHSFVSFMLNHLKANVTEVSKWIGHATVSITLDTYSHLFPNNLRNLADEMDKQLEKTIGRIF